ncbi:MAG: DNA-3-methyladenine glycosylase [Leptolyngbyaceae bacterium]|nr:DNA-3-methyladenine glycosylase [Leptolyngbyaceae bacterium]
MDLRVNEAVWEGQSVFTWLSRPATAIAPELLGCTLVRQLSNGSILRGLIVETEAYTAGDPACHAYRRRTPRNQVMFGRAGFAYVYLIYGIYHCFNVVTDIEGVPGAVLVRALQLDSIPSWMVENPSPKLQALLQSPASRQYEQFLHRLAAGPGKLCQALQIDLSLTATELSPGQPLWLEPRCPEFQQGLDQNSISVIQTTRIGLTQGIELPWRWYIGNCPSVSRKAKDLESPN